MDKAEQAACNGDQREDPAETMDEESAAKEKLTDDPNKVKFTSVNLDGFDGKNGEAKVDIYVAQATVGMNKEELMKYANEPFWVRLRMFLFVFFWIAWVAMLVGAVVIILLAPRCPPAPKLDWYQKTAIYEVDVEAFKDSDGDGVGDLKGLISKLDYFKINNIGTILLSSFYEMVDGGILNHTKIDSRFGTMADFDDLVSKVNENGIKLVIDFNPDHTSNKHEWFLNAIKDDEQYEDYYIWQSVPNNWMNISGQSAWCGSRSSTDKSFLCTFGYYTRDLNLRNEKVKSELKYILRFWLNKGVHGFRVLSASNLIEDKDFRDEPLGMEKAVDSPSYDDINHIFTVDQPENFGLFAEWREVLNDFPDSAGLRKILLAETSGSLNSTLLYYGNGTYTLAELPYNSQMTQISKTSTGIQLKEIIDTWAKNAPENAWPTFLVGSRLTKRLADRVGDLIDGIHMVSVIARGTPITFYGDELGMVNLIEQGMDHLEPWEKEKMPKSLMLWTNETGVTSGGWVHPNYESINVETQEKDKQSHLNIFKHLLGLRGQPALGFGLQQFPVITYETFSMIRVRKGSPGYLVVINLSDTPTNIDFTDTNEHLPEMARVEIRSKNIKTGLLAEGGLTKISLQNIPLDAKQAVVLSFVPHFKG